MQLGHFFTVFQLKEHAGPRNNPITKNQLTNLGSTNYHEYISPATFSELDGVGNFSQFRKESADHNQTFIGLCDNVHKGNPFISITTVK